MLVCRRQSIALGHVQPQSATLDHCRRSERLAQSVPARMVERAGTLFSHALRTWSKFSSGSISSAPRPGRATRPAVPEIPGQRRGCRRALPSAPVLSPTGRQTRFERPVTTAQPPVQHQCGLEFPSLTQRAFPDDRHSPSGFEQMVTVAPVPTHVVLELCLPEFLASGRGGGVRAPKVTVPEAAVNETHGSESTKHEVRGTRELAVVQPVSQAACVESPAKSDFGYSVPASNPCHHARASGLVDYVRHLSLPHQLRGIPPQTNLARGVGHDQVRLHFESRSRGCPERQFGSRRAGRAVGSQPALSSGAPGPSPHGRR